MKKWLSFALALLMTLTLAVPAFGGVDAITPTRASTDQTTFSVKIFVSAGQAPAMLKGASHVVGYGAWYTDNGFVLTSVARFAFVDKNHKSKGGYLTYTAKIVFDDPGSALVTLNYLGFTDADCFKTGSLKRRVTVRLGNRGQELGIRRT